MQLRFPAGHAVLALFVASVTKYLVGMSAAPGATVKVAALDELQPAQKVCPEGSAETNKD